MAATAPATAPQRSGAARALAPRDAARDAPEGLPPGPRAHPLLQTLAWAIAPTWVMDNCARRLGESFTLTFWPSGMTLAMVSGPEAVKTVFTAPPDVAPSAAGNSPLRPVMGPSSVIVLTGPEHMRQRKLLLPPFHGERMREYEQTIVDATRKDMATWPLGEPMRLHERTRSITLEVILRAVFGVEAERMGALRTAIEQLIAPIGPRQAVQIALRVASVERPTGAIGRALDRLDAVIHEELARRRGQQDLAQRTDILSLLLQARDEDGQAMTDDELRDELVTLLLAGHETTATSVAWAIERLVRHPGKLARLVAEIDAGDGDDRYMTAVSPRRCACARSCRSSRARSRSRSSVDGYRMPAGTRLAPSIYLTNRNARVYDDPHELPARALPRRRARDVLLDPLRRRHPPLHRRFLRAAGDEAHAAHDARRAYAARGRPARQAGSIGRRSRRAQPPPCDHARALARRPRRVEQALTHRPQSEVPSLT